MTMPSDAHLLAFGRVIHNYALCEMGIKITLSGLLQISLGDALVLFEPYSASDLRNVAKSTAKEALKPRYAEQVCQLVGDWFHFNGLRNLIAHSRWSEGGEPGSIKVRGVSIREGKAQWKGDGEDEPSYTAKELEESAAKLAAVNLRIKEFLDSTGLQASIDRNIWTPRAERSARSGSPTNIPDK